MDYDQDNHPVVQGIAIIGALAAVVFSAWCTVIAFIGGTMPIIGVETAGGLGTGLLWVFIIDPIVITVCYWITLVVLMPFAAVGAARDAARERRSR